MPSDSKNCVLSPYVFPNLSAFPEPTFMLLTALLLTAVPPLFETTKFCLLELDLD